MLDAGSVGERKGCKPETDGYAHHWPQFVAPAAHDGVHNTVEDRNEYQDGDRIKVLHNIVWHAVALHLASLRDEIGRELAVADPKNWVENEDLAGSESTIDLVDKVVVPWHRPCLAVLGAPRRFCSLRVSS